MFSDETLNQLQEKATELEAKEVILEETANKLQASELEVTSNNKIDRSFQKYIYHKRANFINNSFLQLKPSSVSKLLLRWTFAAKPKNLVQRLSRAEQRLIYF
jgi:hypothetical protein